MQQQEYMKKTLTIKLKKIHLRSMKVFLWVNWKPLLIMRNSLKTSSVSFIACHVEKICESSFGKRLCLETVLTKGVLLSMRVSECSTTSAIRYKIPIIPDPYNMFLKWKRRYARIKTMSDIVSLFCFLTLKKRAFETWKNVFCFISKLLSFLRYSNFRIFDFFSWSHQSLK